MAGLPDLEQLIERLEAVTEEARSVERDLHSAVKAARGVERDLKDAVALARDAVQVEVHEQMGEAVKEGLEKYNEAIVDIIKKAEGDVSTMFERKMNLLMYGSTQRRGESIFDRLRAHADMLDQMFTDAIPIIKVVHDGGLPATLPHLPHLRKGPPA